jgi:predicted transposase/invertase (TIGR01784 family)
MNHTLLDPRNDLVFKMLFANSLPLLTDLINAVRCNEPPIVVESVQNPRIEAEEWQGKFIILDILAKDEAGHYYNIEMQMSKREQWNARSMVYLAKTLAGQLKSGDNYASLKPVIGIHLLCYDLFDDPEQALWCFEMRDRINPSIVLGREMQLNIVELKKADQLASLGGATGAPGNTASSAPAKLTALAAWITYFAHWKEENIMNQIAYPPVLEALQQLKALSADDETRRLAEVRERAIMSERTEIEAALTKGKEIGVEIGVEIGEARALRRMIESGIPEAQARAILHM